MNLYSQIIIIIVLTYFLFFFQKKQAKVTVDNISPIATVSSTISNSILPPRLITTFDDYIKNNNLKVPRKPISDPSHYTTQWF